LTLVIVNLTAFDVDRIDPPESGGSRSGGGDLSERVHGLAHRTPMEAAAAAAERNSMYLPIHGRMGMGPSPGTARGLLHHLQMSDLQQRIYERQQQARLQAGLASGGAGWGHTNPTAGAAAGRRFAADSQEAEAAAEDHWRAQQGLPPLPGGGFTAGQLGRTGRGLPGEEKSSSSPGLRARHSPGEFDGAPGNAVGAVPGSADGGSGNALFDILATAAAAAERKEGIDDGDSPPEPKEKKKRGKRKSDGDAKKAALKVPPKHNKRKRKGANEPKNPLGAFVCKYIRLANQHIYYLFQT
jgi:hypothetical protein